MGRIRSIKPETSQSQTLGRVSRDARLFFLLLITIADDAGRAPADPRLLASLLLPFDDDKREVAEASLNELEAEGCIRRYSAEGNFYLDIPNWLKHQRIEKPSPSKIPAFDDCSENSPRDLPEASATIRHGKGKERKGEEGTGTRPEGRGGDRDRKERTRTVSVATGPPSGDAPLANGSRRPHGGSPDPNIRELSDDEIRALPMEQRREYVRKLAEMPAPQEASR